MKIQIHQGDRTRLHRIGVEINVKPMNTLVWLSRGQAEELRDKLSALLDSAPTDENLSSAE